MKLVDLIKQTSSLRKRQYAVVRLGSLDYKYVKNNKQLFISALAFPSKNSGRTSPYKVQIVFNQVESSENPTKQHIMPYSSKAGAIDYYLEQLTINHDVSIRCQCPDFYFMWSYYDKQNKALLGPHKPYVRKTDNYPPKNPEEKPGLCKHTLQLVKMLMGNDVIKKQQQVWNYLNRPVRIQ